MNAPSACLPPTIDILTSGLNATRNGLLMGKMETKMLEPEWVEELERSQ